MMPAATKLAKRLEQSKNLRGVFRKTDKALKDVNVCYIYRPCHNGSRQAFLFARDVTFTLNKVSNGFSKFTYTTAPNLNSSTAHQSSDTETSCENGNEYLKKYNITVKGNNVPPPVLSIEEAKFPVFINKVLKEHNVITPTPIQAAAWPIALSGRDFVGISPTGSGKTLAFAIPAVMRVKQMKPKNEDKRSQSPFAMVLAPTRELAQQIEEVMKWFQDPFLRCVAAYGGVGKENQLRQIYKGVEIIIATPGRCCDLLDNGEISLDRCSFLVLDEADRMLDMGFLPQIEPIIKALPDTRQSLMWSATWPKEVQSIASKFLQDYIHISVGSVELKPSESVKQTVIMCASKMEKKQKLIEFLDEVTRSDAKILIFAETKKAVNILEYSLRSKGFNVGSIHGDKSQNARDTSLRNFRTGRTKVLIATAVAARGLDVDNITHVVNYDCPKESEEYVHKIGRTGRHNKNGEAITYVTCDDDFAGYLIDMLIVCNQEVPRELLSFRKVPVLNRYAYSHKTNRTQFLFKNRRANFRNMTYKERDRDGWD